MHPLSETVAIDLLNILPELVTLKSRHRIGLRIPLQSRWQPAP